MQYTLLLLMMLSPVVTLAADMELSLRIKDHKFNPADVRVPAGKKIKLVVYNQDTGPEEFESYELNREKIIAGNSSTNIYIGPLEPGKYPFFGEFHEDTAQGMIVVE
jgi:plastocyanin